MYGRQMSYTPKILAFSGSLRKDSYNKKLVKIAAAGATEAGASVTYIDLSDYPLPIYDQDYEDSKGLPEAALKLKQLMLNHDGFLIASPEYNSSISAVLKNVIDWVSRPASASEQYLCCFIGKVVVLMSASPGELGGMRGLVHLRSIFTNVSSLVLPQQKSISKAYEAFTEEGDLKNEKNKSDIKNLGKELALFLKKHKT